MKFAPEQFLLTKQIISYHNPEYQNVNLHRFESVKPYED
jgi:hypothetical protein